MPLFPPVKAPTDERFHTRLAALSGYGRSHLLLIRIHQYGVSPVFSWPALPVDNRKSCYGWATEDPMGLPSTKSFRFPVTEYSRDLIDALDYSGHLLQIYQAAGLFRPH